MEWVWLLPRNKIVEEYDQMIIQLLEKIKSQTTEQITDNFKEREAVKGYNLKNVNR